MDHHIYEQIGKFLEPKDLVNCLMVNKEWLDGFGRHRPALRLHGLLKNEIIPTELKHLSEYLISGYQEMFFDHKKFRIKNNLKEGSYRFIQVSKVWSFPAKNNLNMLIVKKYYRNLDALNLF